MPAADKFIGFLSTEIFNPIIRLLFAFALLYFFYGIVLFLYDLSKGKQGSPDEKGFTSGKQHLFWGTIGLFVMFSAWGILGLLQDTVNTFRP